MLWDFIRDFFVQYIFGGVDSQENYYGGMICEGLTTDSSVLHIFDTDITIGSWLSTTMTIICLVLISICFILLVRWLFKAVTSAFLLK